MDSNDLNNLMNDGIESFWDDPDIDGGDEDVYVDAFEGADGEDEEDEDEDYDPDLEEMDEEEDTDEDDGTGRRTVAVRIAVDEDPEDEANPSLDNVRLVTASGAPAPVRINRRQLISILQTMRFGNLAPAEAGSDDEMDDQMNNFLRQQRRGRRSSANGSKYPPVPNPTGQELMRSGLFGTNPGPRDVTDGPQRFSRMLMHRELVPSRDAAVRANRLLAQRMIPSTPADMIINYDERCYSGQFSDDGNFFFSCSQEFLVRMYDTSNPYEWKHYKTVEFMYPQWTITDATLSPDNRRLVYSSIRDTVCMASTDPLDKNEPQMLNFAMSPFAPSRRGWSGRFGIYSVRFSGDGRELVAGTGDHSVYVYDLDAGRPILRIPGHSDDVNAVCFGDKESPHILYSGSDDSLLKVWDRRSLGDNREAGVFVGHVEGLTYIDSKGDGRYVLSNSKDQTMKLWDLRKMLTSEQSAELNPESYQSGFDYRYMPFSEREYRPHPKDCSVVTFRGHSVLKTLIRCHFSPPGSSDSRYVYSGSEDGKVYIYNLDATVAGIIDVQAATYDTRPRKAGGLSSIWDEDDSRSWKTCVRDASWHPNAPLIAATSWNGYASTLGTCTVHSWHDGVAEDESGIPKGRSVGPEIQEDPKYGRAGGSDGLSWARPGRRRRVL